MNIFITGASGFIGQHLCRHLASLGHSVTALHRSTTVSDNTPLPESESTNPNQASSSITLPDISDITAFHLKEIDVVIHLAGIAHRPGAAKSEYHRVNVEGTQTLLEACIEAGVKRLIYLSSIKAIAERSTLPLKTSIAPAPEDDYGISRLAAERLLVAATKLEIAIVRVPLVYGKGVKGNFRSLVKLVASGVPLPFLSIQNKRSYLGVGNLCDFMACCVALEKLPTHIFHLSDGASVSLAGLVRSLYDAMGQQSRSFWVPQTIVAFLGSLLLGRSRASKLFGDLELDVLATTKHTGWVPPYSLHQGLAEMFSQSPTADGRE
ncbi:MAG: NAD-dependent epimerase/dehydratase family protein [Proteobacteria bacterium]|nr:NAD-dependent epimerase/dehydratase family protein [Pseudomonadota bacterium]